MSGEQNPERKAAQITLPLALTALLLLVPVSVSPLMRMEVAGNSREFYMLKGLTDLQAEGLPPVTAILGWCFLGTAFLKNFTLLMLSIRAWTDHGWQQKLAACSRFAGIWESYEVLLIGVVVCMMSLSGMGHSQLSFGFLYLLFLWIISTLAARYGRVLTTVGGKDSSKPKAALEPCVTEALVVTGFLLYVPAMLYPVASISFHGVNESRTLLGGVTELLREDKWLLGGIVFLASIAVPFLKLAGLGTLTLATRMGRPRTPKMLKRVFRLIHTTGRWALLDLFVLVILVSVVDFGFMASVRLESTGVYFFCALVITTLLAAESFDHQSLETLNRAPQL
ncbi:MAG: paraquat-inducible protein A [Verrucomicrobiae bacterium]|nr:paraquat-inducible protein A [Verrucomicrobiae bacterium]